ncbi:MAG: cadherin repeat domain-containing protein, partial [Porticoccaceae bacterium]
LESVVSIPELVADTQHVYVSESTKSEDGTQAIVKVSYNADDSTLTGLGLRIHFDSSALSLSDISDVLSSDLFIPPTTTATADAEDFDNDASTDSYVLASWTSLFGSWPNGVPADLMTLTFDIVDDASGSSTINLTSSSNAAGFSFDGQSHDVAISAESESSESSESEIMASQLSIDSNSGEVTLTGQADYQTVPDYNFTVTADNGTESASQTIGLLVADQLVSSGADSYTGTDDADVFALADGSAQVTSGEGADIFVLSQSSDSWDSSESHTLLDFESGVDSIDISAVLIAAGYTDQSSLTQLADAEISADILDLINADDSSLDNMFGGAFDDTSNVLTLFADTNSNAGITEIDSIQIELGQSSTADEDDITASFIA